MRRLTHVFAFVVMSVALVVVYQIGYERAVVPFFPSHFDQVAHRTAALTVADQASTEGLSGLLSGIADRTTAQGFVHVTLGAVAILAGFDPVYSVFALFLACLGLIGWAFSDRFRSPWRGWAAMSLILSLDTLSTEIGGLLDFRPDFAGQTLWTTATALALASRCFRDRTLILLAGVVLGTAFCTRSLTLAYTLGATPLLVLAAWYGEDREDRRLRMTNLALGIAVALALALPFFMFYFDTLKGYYIDNHISPKENEARGFLGGFGKHLQFYWRSLRELHFGTLNVLVFSLVFTAGVFRSRRRPFRQVWPTLLIGIAFCSPLAVMSMGPQYSFVVAGAYAGSLMLICLVPWLSLSVQPATAALKVLICLSLLTWPVVYLSQCTHYGDTRTEAKHQNANRVLDLIIAESAGQTQCVVSTLHLIEAVNVRMLRLRSHATGQGLGKQFVAGLGDSIYRTESEQHFFEILRRSDIIVYWQDQFSGGPLPANLEVDEYREKIERVLREEYRCISPEEPIVMEGGSLLVYAR